LRRESIVADPVGATYGDDIIPLFILSGRGQVTIVTADTKVATGAGQSIIALGNRVGGEQPSTKTDHRTPRRTTMKRLLVSHDQGLAV